VQDEATLNHSCYLGLETRIPPDHSVQNLRVPGRLILSLTW